MELNTMSLGDFVRLAGIIFEKAKQSLSQEARNSGIFVVENIPMNSGNTREYTEIDLQEYAAFKGEGDQAQRAKVQQGYSKVLTSYRIARDIGITYEMRSQNKYTEVVRRITNLAPLAMNRFDLDLSHRITFGTATSYVDQDGRTIDITTGDGLSLFNTAHLLRGTATTYRNRLANNPQVSRGALEGMERLIVEETLNQFGEKQVIPFDVLWTTDDPNTVNTVREYLQSTAEISATNNGVINVYKGKYRHVILPRVATTAAGFTDATKRRYWGLVSTQFSSAHVGIWEDARLKIPADLNAGEEFSTDDWNFGVRMGYGIAVLSGTFIKMSSGDGVA